MGKTWKELSFRIAVLYFHMLQKYMALQVLVSASMEPAAVQLQC